VVIVCYSLKPLMDTPVVNQTAGSHKRLTNLGAPPTLLGSGARGAPALSSHHATCVAVSCLQPLTEVVSIGVLTRLMGHDVTSHRLLHSRRRQLRAGSFLASLCTSYVPIVMVVMNVAGSKVSRVNVLLVVGASAVARVIDCSASLQQAEQLAHTAVEARIQAALLSSARKCVAFRKSLSSRCCRGRQLFEVVDARQALTWQLCAGAWCRPTKLVHLDSSCQHCVPNTKL